jgi:hypothetical protein
MEVEDTSGVDIMAGVMAGVDNCENPEYKFSPDSPP